MLNEGDIIAAGESGCWFGVTVRGEGDIGVWLFVAGVYAGD